jgi:hypothetical protein
MVGDISLTFFFSDLFLLCCMQAFELCKSCRRCWSFSKWYAVELWCYAKKYEQMHATDLLGDFVVLFCWKFSRR